ncbi:hypothetical protein PPL_02580 [Heterostelium album PN500]|uniref:Uncharacterized protein n=1 Tax=Heterostelium pallidum (strain ATCC 26659 / Pp 5 / PN500) TaxID=670386 RepID=D3B2G7_HETP5|nr:hypothetical protein PPL_02580 [Heterostelium album PN500]EFA83515.1 hypothetical protein PPL_02580 [Heterostelium album PN500]|eukprot:XP_020435632.1 hypothetical protein PPL_02580 [Heterostelium album PN500]
MFAIQSSECTVIAFRFKKTGGATTTTTTTTTDLVSTTGGAAILEKLVTNQVRIEIENR